MFCVIALEFWPILIMFVEINRLFEAMSDVMLVRIVEVTKGQAIA